MQLRREPDGLLDSQKGVEDIVLHHIGRGALKLTVVARLAVGEHPPRQRRAFCVLDATYIYACDVLINVSIDKIRSRKVTR